MGICHRSSYLPGRYFTTLIGICYGSKDLWQVSANNIAYLLQSQIRRGGCLLQKVGICVANMEGIICNQTYVIDTEASTEG